MMSIMVAMTNTNRTELAAAANEAVRGARRAMPILTSESSRESVLFWLQSNDPNGVYEDRFREEGEEPLSIEDAWELIAGVVEES